MDRRKGRWNSTAKWAQSNVCLICGRVKMTLMEHIFTAPTPSVSSFAGSFTIPPFISQAKNPLLLLHKVTKCEGATMGHTL